MSELADRLAEVRSSITAEATRLAREEPTLIVVTKNHPVELVSELYELGERDFGENRVQEALPKFMDFNRQTNRGDAKWHLIGQLQTNKVKQALEFADSIHSLDRVSLLEELVKRTQSLDQVVEVFVQVNLTDDENRGGATFEQALSLADGIAATSQLRLMGLMAVATIENAPEQDFERISTLSQKLLCNHPKATSLSIGMSNDYLLAMQYGATHLRIGTAITGNRAI